MGMKKLAALVMVLVLCLTAVSAMAAVTINSPYTTTAVLDLGGQTVETSTIVIEDGGNLTVKNGTLKNTGDVFNVQEGGVLTIAADATIISQNSNCIYIGYEGATAHVYGKLISHSTNYAAIQGNGSNHGTTINIYSGAYVEAKDNHAIYHPQSGTLNVFGGTIIGKTGIEMRAGTLNVEGGTITATGAPNGPVQNGNGSSFEGVAVAIAQHTTGLNIDVDISGGTLVAENDNGGALIEMTAETVTSEALDKIKVKVSGGIFDGYVMSANEDGYITGGTFAAGFEQGDVAKNAAAAEVVEESGVVAVGKQAISNALAAVKNPEETLLVMWQGSVSLKGVPAGVSVLVMPGTSVTINGANVPGTELDDDGRPVNIYVVPAQYSGSVDLPQTGDNTSLMLWSAMLALAAAGFVVSRKTRLN